MKLKLTIILNLIVLLSIAVMVFSNFGKSEGFIDSPFYLDFAKYFKDIFPKENLKPPYYFRPLVPFFSSLLPFSLNINFGIVNSVAIILSYIVLFKFLRKLNFNEIESYIGVFIFVLSYPVFLYFPAVLTDAVGFLFLLGGIYLVFTDSIWFFIAATLGILTREINAILLLIYFVKNRRWDKKHFLLLIPITALVFVRIFFGISKAGFSYWWKPTLLNFIRPEAYLHIILGLGLIIIFILFFVIKFKECKEFLVKNQNYNFLRYTFLILLLIPLYAFIVAYFDSRYMIVLYPILIPFSLCGIRCLVEFKNKPWPFSKIS